MNKEILLDNINKIHTTNMGIDRIKRNLEIDDDVVNFCISKIKESNDITRIGKNYYIKQDNIIITINAYSYTIITAKKQK